MLRSCHDSIYCDFNNKSNNLQNQRSKTNLDQKPRVSFRDWYKNPQDSSWMMMMEVQLVLSTRGFFCCCPPYLCRFFSVFELCCDRRIRWNIFDNLHWAQGDRTELERIFVGTDTKALNDAITRWEVKLPTNYCHMHACQPSMKSQRILCRYNYLFGEPNYSWTFDQNL